MFTSNYIYTGFKAERGLKFRFKLVQFDLTLTTKWEYELKRGDLGQLL